MGQTKPVVVYRFCSKNTIDERILNFATAKRKLEKMIIGSGKIILHHLFNSYDSNIDLILSKLTIKNNIFYC